MKQFNDSQHYKFRFALVGHTEELANAVRDAINPNKEELIVQIVKKGDAVTAAKTLFNSGVEVVFGHMGATRLMRNATGKTVVDIPLSSIDLIEAFEKAKKIDSVIGLTSYLKPRDDIPKIEKLLNISIHPIIFDSYSDMETNLRKAFKNGINVFVGGGASRKIVTELGGKHFVPEPRTTVVKEALEEARTLATVRRKQLESEERVRTIIHEMDEGIIGIDQYGRIDIVNKRAHSILGIDNQGGNKDRYREHIKDTHLLNVLKKGEPALDQILNINRNKFLVSAFPISIGNRSRGAVALLRDVHKVENMNRKVREELYQKGFLAKHTVSDIKGNSPALRKMMERARLYAATDGAVCIQGETGVGKDLFAEAIHNMSKRKNAPFVAINCAALPEHLLESELFGYEEGAFTGAKRGGKIGLFEIANKGTLFLDEIGDISRSLQVRLLRVIESKEVMRVGGDKYVPVDIRILTASHKDFRLEIARERFRADLYYRISTLKLKIPPLRNRLQDIPDIIKSLLSKSGKPCSIISNQMYNRLGRYQWPGNIRELASFIETYLTLLGQESDSEPLFKELMDDLEESGMFDLICPPHNEQEANVMPYSEYGLKQSDKTSLKEMVEAFEYRAIDNMLKANEFNRAKSAERLGISPNTLWRKYNQYSQKPK